MLTGMSASDAENFRALLTYFPVMLVVAAVNLRPLDLAKRDGWRFFWWMFAFVSAIVDASGIWLCLFALQNPWRKLSSDFGFGYAIIAALLTGILVLATLIVQTDGGEQYMSRKDRAALKVKEAAIEAARLSNESVLREREARARFRQLRRR
jgi:hypothetical protein